MVCRLIGTKASSKPMLGYYQVAPGEQIPMKSESMQEYFHWIKFIKEIVYKMATIYLCFNMLRCRKTCFRSNCAMRLHFTVSFCHMYNAILQVLFLVERNINSYLPNRSQIAKFMGSTWGPPWSCRPQMNPMLAQWTLLSWVPALHQVQQQYFRRGVWRLTPSAESSAPQVSQLDDHWVFSHLGRRSDNQA